MDISTLFRGCADIHGMQRIDGAGLRDIRIERGLRIAEIARRTGLDRLTIKRIEEGKRVSRSTRRLFAIALNVPVFMLDEDS